MRMRFKGIALATGLLLTGLGAASQAAQPAPQGAAAPAGVSNIAPTTANATAPAAPASPLLAQDGAPAVQMEPGVGHPVDGRIGIQPQVTTNGEFATGSTIRSCSR